MSNKKFFPILFFSLIVLVFSPISILVSAVEIPNPLRAKTFQELIYNIVDFLFNLAIPLAALMIIVAGFYFVTATGKPEQITTAKQIILWTLIGFLIILCAKGIVWFLMERVFQRAP